MKRTLDNLGQNDRIITVRSFIPWDSDTSQRIDTTAKQQIDAENRFTACLVDHPDTPIQKSAAKGETGLNGLWLEWRETDAYLAEYPQAVWRPAAKLARAKTSAWNATNNRHAEFVCKAETARLALLAARKPVETLEAKANANGLTADERGTLATDEKTLQAAEDTLHDAVNDARTRLEAASERATSKRLNADPHVKTAKQTAAKPRRPVAKMRKHAETRGLSASERDELTTARKALKKAGAAFEKAQRKARNAEKRHVDPASLLVSQKQRDRRRRNRVVFHDSVRTSDDRQYLTLPGIGTVALTRPVPAKLNVRSAVLIERTPPAKGNCRRLPAGQRTWRVLVQGRINAPLKPIPDDPAKSRSVGIDHGVKHAITESGSDGTSTHRHYTPLSKRDIKEWSRLDRQEKRCTPGSRSQKAIRRRKRNITGSHARRKHEERTRWANEIAQAYDHVGIEKLPNANMRGSAKGQNEAHGKNVAAKRGLNRALAETAPGYQTHALVAACIRHGATFRLVPAAWTSTTCSRCGYNDSENRESQSVFRCRSCGYEANADVNAGENVRLLALAYNRVGVDRPWMARAVENAEALAKAAGPEERPPRRNSTWILPPPPKEPPAEHAGS